MLRLDLSGSSNFFISATIFYFRKTLEPQSGFLFNYYVVDNRETGRKAGVDGGEW